MVEVGDVLEDFGLPGSDGHVTRLSEMLEGRKALVVAVYLFAFSGG